MAVPIAAIISGGVATGGAVTNYYANRETNKANEAINQRNLEFQYQQWMRERDEANRQRLEDRSWFESDRAHQEMRDDAAYQREFEAYRNLGLNPYMMMMQNGAGAAQSPVGVQSSSVNVPHGSVPNMIPMRSPNLDFSGIANLANAVIGSINSQREQNRADRVAQSNIEYNQVRGWSDMVKAASDAKNAATDAEYKHFLGQLADVQRKDVQFNIDFKRETAELDKIAKSINNQYLQDVIRHQQQQDLVAWFNAHTSRLSAQSQKALNDATINRIANDIISIKLDNYVRASNVGGEIEANSEALEAKRIDALVSQTRSYLDKSYLDTKSKNEVLKVISEATRYAGENVSNVLPILKTIGRP